MCRELPNVTIVVLSWNNYDDTYECLRSIENLNYPAYSVIVVDNGSTDDSTQRLMHQFSKTEFAINKENYGYAKGNNIGINVALSKGADYVWIINNDVVVEENALLNMVDAAESDDKVGIIGSKVFFYDEPQRLWFAGGIVNKWTGVCRHIGSGEIDRGQYDVACEVDYITGCNLLIKKACIDDIGLIDENYFLYYEDADWAVRAKRSGWKVVYLPVPGAWHRIAASLKEPSLTMGYYFTRNGLYFIWQNFKSHIPVAVVCSPRYSLINHIPKGRWQVLLMCLRGYRDFFSMRMGERVF